MSPDELPDDRPPPSDPSAALVLPIRQDTLVEHVTSHARQLKRLQESGPRTIDSVRTMLARFLVDVDARWGEVARMTRAQDVVLTKIDGGVWLMTRVIIPVCVALVGAGWAVYVFMHK